MKNNRNVALALAFSALSSCARGVWSFVTATNYLRLLGSVDSVGVAEGMQGLSQALFAVLAGVAADKSSRDRVLKAAGMVGILSVVCTLFALFADFKWVTTARRFDMVVVALVCWGAYQGIWTTSLESIFADSVKTGNRSRFNTRKFSVMQIASISGPAIAILIFLSDNKWSDAALRRVFAAGVLLSLPSILLLFFFRDGYSLGRSSESHTSPMLLPSHAAETSSGDYQSIQPAQGYQHSSRIKPTKVPIFVLASDIISGFGSGLTVKFFPLFFSQKIGLSPVETNSIYLALPLLLSVEAAAAQGLSRCIGRVYVCVIFSTFGAFALVLLWYLDAHALDRKVSSTTIVAIYLLSTIQHSCRPLKKSLLMDFVPKRRRARWNSLDSVTRLGWSGSALAGGFIISKYGYGKTFLLTAALQTVAALILLPLTCSDAGHNERERQLSTNNDGPSIDVQDTTVS